MVKLRVIQNSTEYKKGLLLITEAFKKAKFFFLLLLPIHGITHSSNFQNQFYTLFLPQYHTNFYFADNSKIELKNQSSHFLFTMKWQQKIIKGFIEFFAKIQDEISISIEQLFELYSSKDIVKDYGEYQNKKLSKLYSDPETILEENINYYLLSFLQENFQKYISIDNVEFILNPNIPYIAEAIYDSKAEKYIIVLNSIVYKLENINKIKNTNKHCSLYFHKQSNDGSTISINYIDLIHSGFIIAASTIHHKFNLLGFILLNYKFHGSSIHDETLLLLSRLISFQLDLEIILQSNNPLEIACFYQTLDPFPDNKKHWKKLIENIENIYDEKSLKKFKKIISSHKKEKQTHD